MESHTDGEYMNISAKRVARIIASTASLITGNYTVELKLDESADDEFTRVEYSINFRVEQPV